MQSIYSNDRHSDSVRPTRYCSTFPSAPADSHFVSRVRHCVPSDSGTFETRKLRKNEFFGIAILQKVQTRENHVKPAKLWVSAVWNRTRKNSLVDRVYKSLNHHVEPLGERSGARFKKDPYFRVLQTRVQDPHIPSPTQSYQYSAAHEIPTEQKNSR